MNITIKKLTIALATSATLSTGLILPLIANADSNPFISVELMDGYMQLAEGTGMTDDVPSEQQKKIDRSSSKNTIDTDKTAKENKSGEAKSGSEMKEKAKHDESKNGSDMKED